MLTTTRSPLPYVLLLTVLFTIYFFSTTFASTVHSLRLPEGNRGNEVLTWVTRRQLEEETNTSLILAAKRTRRKDPLDRFHTYTGGFNISNKHYLASVCFSAAPFFIIAGVWFVLFGLSLLIIGLRHCCCPKDPYGYSRICYALSLIFLIFFTISAIVGCILLYTGQGKFHSITTTTLGFVVNKADETAENLRNVSDYLDAAKNVDVERTPLPGNVKQDIDDIKPKINSSSNTLSTRTQKNSKVIKRALDSTRLALVIIAAVMLALVFIGFLFSIFGLKSLVYTLVIIGWILVTGTFILCGIFLLFHNVVADTCVAMNEWVLNPTAKTAMDDIIPCVDNATAQQMLLRTKEATYQLVNVMDMIINNVANRNVPPQVGPPLYFNQSGPLVPVLCNPSNSNYSVRQCAAGEVELINATEVWKNYVCQVSPSGICTTPGRLTPSIYNQMASAVNVSYGLYHYGPFLVDLRDCTFVRQLFTEIHRDYCPDLNKYIKFIYIGLMMVSLAVMLSLLFWVIYARERKHRVYTKQLINRNLEGGHKDPY